MTDIAMTSEADVVKHRRWLGNGTATFVIALFAMLMFAGYIVILAIAPQLLNALSPEQRGAVLGTLSAQFVSAVQYFIGSSLSSANKSIELAAIGGKK